MRRPTTNIEKALESYPPSERAIRVELAETYDKLEEARRDLADAQSKAIPLLRTAWNIIANAGDGSWGRESPDWRRAATQWRDAYFKVLKEDGSRPPRQGET